MSITIEYSAQIKQALGLGSERIELGSSPTLRGVMEDLARRHGEPFRNLVHEGGGLLRGPSSPQPSPPAAGGEGERPATSGPSSLNSTALRRTALLLAVNDEQVFWETPLELRDGDVVRIMTPIAGG